MGIYTILSTSQFKLNLFWREIQQTIGYITLLNMTSRCDGKGPKNFRPKGFNPISSKLSRRLVAKNSAMFLVSRGRCLRHLCQYVQRVRGVPGRYNSLARSGSKPGNILPPGQQRSPGCLTLLDRLVKMRQGSDNDFFLFGCEPRRNNTADVWDEWFAFFKKRWS